MYPTTRLQYKVASVYSGEGVISHTQHEPHERGVILCFGEQICRILIPFGLYGIAKRRLQNRPVVGSLWLRQVVDS